MLKDRAWIEAHVPHQGTMCLLDAVLDWDADRVRCSSRAHRLPDNPLRARGTLAAICGVEFAAQAMAVHGALLAAEGAPVRAGYLASLRAVNLRVAHLDDIDAPLIATAHRLGGDGGVVLYGFALAAGARTLLDGRATIALRPAAARSA